MLEEKEFNDFCTDIDQLTQHVEKIKSLEDQVYSEQQAYAKEYEKRLKQIKNLRNEIDTPESKKRYLELVCKLKQVGKTRLVKQPWPLWLYLGSANFYLAGSHRISYKVEYERTKTIGVLIYAVLCILQLAFNNYILDAIANFFLLYHYSTMTVREHILVVNGSNIRPWWIIHHYLSIFLAGTLLIWPFGPTYMSVRTELLYFGLYLSGVQLLQYKLQVNRLYTLRALSRVDPMETTTDAENLHMPSGLVFLLPFLFFGHSVQFYLSYRFYKVGLEAGHLEWQPVAMCFLFAAVAAGNVTMTLLTVVRKARAKRNAGSRDAQQSKKTN